MKTRPLATFFQSSNYKNFCLFILKCSVLVGVSAAIGFTLLVMQSGHSLSISFAMPVYIFFIGLIFGLSTSVVGFCLLYLFLKMKVPFSFEVISALVGTLLCAVVLIFFYAGSPISGNFDKLWFAIPFPIAPVVFCIYGFIRFSIKHIKLVNKHKLL